MRDAGPVTETMDGVEATSEERLAEPVAPAGAAALAPETAHLLELAGHGRAEERVDSVVVLDFGAQYSQLITRRVREANVYCELLPCDVPAEQALALQPRGVILSGGPNSVYEPGAPQLPAWVLESGLPVLGICYGMQLLAHALGGRVARAVHREYGPASIEVVAAGEGPSIFARLPRRLDVWMSHGDRIEELPPGFVPLAASANSPHAAMARGRLIGLQFHPEVAHTPRGKELLRNFLYGVCGCRGGWMAQNFIEAALQLRSHSQMSDRNVVRICCPYGVWTTSGWNWIP